MLGHPYYWLKAIHLIFMVAWIASLLIYPRYKLHQVTSQPNGELFERMKDASNLLRRLIMTPSMVIVWAAGLSMLAFDQGRAWLVDQGWLHAKLLLLVGLSGLHGFFIALGRKIDAGEKVSAKRLKLLNEVPFLLLIAIILLAVLKPF